MSTQRQCERNKGWREYVDSLPPAKIKAMLVSVLTWQLEYGGQDIRFRSADEPGEIPELYWEWSGDPIDERFQ